jgi:hypothetical protein
LAKCAGLFCPKNADFSVKGILAAFGVLFYKATGCTQAAKFCQPPHGTALAYTFGRLLLAPGTCYRDTDTHRLPRMDAWHKHGALWYYCRFLIF